MASAALDSLSLIFLVAGVTLWLTSLGLSRRARQYRTGMQTLLQLASQELAPLDIPAAAWPVLQSVGWVYLSLQGNWYGQPVQGALGRAKDKLHLRGGQQTHTLSSGDEVQLTLHLTHRHTHGEQRLFATQLAHVFLLLLETRLRERTGALSAALAERARLTLYLQHDMRNLAQWVSWVCTDFAAASTAQSLLAAAQRLRDNAPLAQERAQRLNAALGRAQHSDTTHTMNLRTRLEQAAQLAGLQLDIDGEATAWIAPSVLARALDNLLSNLAGEWRAGKTAAPTAHLATVPGSDHTPAVAQITLRCPLPSQGMGLPPEKLFEPFASGTPGGLGLGLYQARRSLRDAGASLDATLLDGQLQFILRLPLCAAPAAPTTV